MTNLETRQCQVLNDIQNDARLFLTGQIPSSIFTDRLARKNSLDEVLKSTALADLTSEALILERPDAEATTDRSAKIRALADYALKLSDRDITD